jgi:hypothetical protein
MFLLCKSISSVINENVCFESLLGHLFVMIDDKKILLIVCFYIFDSYILHCTCTSNVSEKMYSLRMSLRGLIMRGYFGTLCWRTTNDCSIKCFTLRVYFESLLWGLSLKVFCVWFLLCESSTLWFTLKVYFEGVLRQSILSVNDKKFLF